MITTLMKIVLLILCFTLSLSSLISAKVQKAKVGESVPAFSLTTTDGNILKSDQLQGKVFLLDFWASDCAPCIKTFPELKRLSNDFEGKVQLISISVADPSDQETATPIINKYQLHWPQVFSKKGEVQDVWKMFCRVGNNQMTIPFYALINKDGYVVYTGQGGYQFSEVRAKIKELLNNK